MERESETYEERAEEVTQAPDEGADQEHQDEPGTDEDEQSSRTEK